MSPDDSCMVHRCAKTLFVLPATNAKEEICERCAIQLFQLSDAQEPASSPHVEGKQLDL